MVASDNRQEALIGYYNVLAQPNPPFLMVKLRGLLPETPYEVQGTGKVFYDDELMYLGFPLPLESHKGDFLSYVWHLRAKCPEQ